MEMCTFTVYSQSRSNTAAAAAVAQPVRRGGAPLQSMTSALHVRASELREYESQARNTGLLLSLQLEASWVKFQSRGSGKLAEQYSISQTRFWLVIVTYIILTYFSNKIYCDRVYQSVNYIIIDVYVLKHDKIFLERRRDAVMSQWRVYHGLIVYKQFKARL